MSGNGSDGSTFEQMRAAGEAAGAKSSQNELVTGCEEEFWFELTLVDQDGNELRNEPCVVVDSAGNEYPTKTDAYGLIRIPGLADGDCTVEFPDLEEEDLSAE